MVQGTTLTSKTRGIQTRKFNQPKIKSKAPNIQQFNRKKTNLHNEKLKM